MTKKPKNKRIRKNRNPEEDILWYTLKWHDGSKKDNELLGWILTLYTDNKNLRPLQFRLTLNRKNKDLNILPKNGIEEWMIFKLFQMISELKNENHINYNYNYEKIVDTLDYNKMIKILQKLSEYEFYNLKRYVYGLEYYDVFKQMHKHEFNNQWGYLTHGLNKEKDNRHISSRRVLDLKYPSLEERMDIRWLRGIK